MHSCDFVEFSDAVRSFCTQKKKMLFLVSSGVFIFFEGAPEILGFESIPVTYFFSQLSNFIIIVRKYELTLKAQKKTVVELESPCNGKENGVLNKGFCFVLCFYDTGSQWGVAYLDFFQVRGWLLRFLGLYRACYVVTRLFIYGEEMCYVNVHIVT